MSKHPVIRFLAACFVAVSLLSFVWELYGMHHGYVPCNAWNLFMFLWMPIVVLFLFFVAIWPVVLVYAFLKILF